MAAKERYVINCKVCERHTYLRYEDGDFICTNCSTIYGAEDGVLDLFEIEAHYQTYLGAKTAGLIKDKEVHDGN